MCVRGAPLTQPLQSTDGHSGNWAFSAARLNWHVAVLAAERGGCLLVDATRSATKRFPDALSKTVPIWCAVLNAALAAFRGAAVAEACAGASLSLPTWVADSEAAAIQQRLPGMLDTLLSLGADVAGLAAALHRPLRCLWLTQASPLWALPDAASLPFTPIICVSASAPMLGHGQRRVSGDAASFVYVPGAGDDEECWSGGLTAQLFARHRAELLAAAACGDERLAGLAQRLSGRGSRPAWGPPARQLAPCGPALSTHATGLHDLPPVGVTSAVACPQAVPVAKGRISRLAGSLISLASFAALQRGPALWSHVDAALLLCDGCPEAAAEEATSLLRPELNQVLCLRVLRAHGSAGVAKRDSLLVALPAALAFADASLRAGRRLLVACADGCERSPAAAVALLAALFVEKDGALQLLDGPPAAACKQALSRWLAAVSADHPEARPTRGLLKQAFQFHRVLSGEANRGAK